MVKGLLSILISLFCLLTSAQGLAAGQEIRLAGSPNVYECMLRQSTPQIETALGVTLSASRNHSLKGLA